jgi:hypothetical protein
MDESQFSSLPRLYFHGGRLCLLCLHGGRLCFHDRLLCKLYRQTLSRRSLELGAWSCRVSSAGPRKLEAVVSRLELEAAVSSLGHQRFLFESVEVAAKPSVTVTAVPLSEEPREDCKSTRSRWSFIVVLSRSIGKRNSMLTVSTVCTCDNGLAQDVRSKSRCLVRPRT